ncbi:MAG: DNA methyltransferase [Syntrophomonadaceae bacterium]|nr:DNA methyltransferase [Syntrophomonadaceae bacterium]
MESKVSTRLIWDGKGLNQGIIDSQYIHKEVERVFPNPLFQTGELFHNTTGNNMRGIANINNHLFKGDNLQVIDYLLQQGYAEKVDLIYIDPPYLSDSKYRSRVTIGDKKDNQVLNRDVFDDDGIKDIDSYLDNIYPRLSLMKKLLTARGSIFVHLDWHVSHYVKLLLDEIFAPDNFINEIIWCYTGGSGTKRHFHRKHDCILWYARSEDYIFNPQYRPYSQGTLERGLTRVKGDKYRLRKQGAILQDWWVDINKILSPTARENLKFPTQKPAALLKRLIEAASNPDSLVADFYSGSGTIAQVCEELGRNWIICDNSEIALETSLSRLVKNKSRPFTVETIELPAEDEIIKLTLKEPVINAIDKNSCLLSIGINNYIPADVNLQMVKEESPFVPFISFWEIDLNYNGITFNSDLQVCRENNQYDYSLPVDMVVNIPCGEKRSVAVKVYDVFGKTAVDVFTITT